MDLGQPGTMFVLVPVFSTVVLAGFVVPSQMMLGSQSS